jgi:hypothetical protein
LDGTAKIWWIEEAAFDGEVAAARREGNRLAASFACGDAIFLKKMRGGVSNTDRALAQKLYL